MTRGTRKTGEFCWINVLTPKPADARAFFGQVLGWKYVEMPGIGHRIQVAGCDVGGLFDVVSPAPPGAPPMPSAAPIMGVMLKVEDVDEACERVIALGGKARPAFDIGTSGRMSVCFDPSGAEFDLWQPIEMHGTDVDSSLPGAPSWFELMTSDLERAGAFYTRLFGWTPQALPLPMPGSKYVLFQSAGEAVAGALLITPRMGDVASHWRTYFTVADVESTLRRAVELGATIDMDVRDVPDGRIAGLTSPQGVEFCLSERSG